MKRLRRVIELSLGSLAYALAFVILKPLFFGMSLYEYFRNDNMKRCYWCDSPDNVLLLGRQFVFLGKRYWECPRCCRAHIGEINPSLWHLANVIFRKF